ncbi:hypothetical protein QFC21_005396 [Naganishia friedmannii]|uniref:Uncharacterized protein n=1 Tax=Naganishia friedmannii TaxID=89922 RepID=A0ACC2VAZ2_9TREE|nr:hypothetical protein QFC21_005396 [Naganishia friedmannii]
MNIRKSSCQRLMSDEGMDVDDNHSRDMSVKGSEHSSIRSKDSDGPFHGQQRSAVSRRAEAVRGTIKSVRKETSTWTYKILSKFPFKSTVHGKDTSQLDETDNLIGLGSTASKFAKPTKIYRVSRSACYRTSAGLSGIRTSLSKSVSCIDRSQATAAKGSPYFGIGLKRNRRAFLPLQTEMETHPDSGSITQDDDDASVVHAGPVKAGDNSGEHGSRAGKQKSRSKDTTAADLPRSLLHRRRELERLVDILNPKPNERDWRGRHSKVYEAERHLVTLKKAACIFGTLVPPDREEDLIVTADRIIEDLRYCCSPASSRGDTQPPWEAAYERGRTASLTTRPNMDLYHPQSWTRHIPMVGPLISLCDFQPHPNSLELLEREKMRLVRAMVPRNPSSDVRDPYQFS